MVLPRPGVDGRRAIKYRKSWHIEGKAAVGSGRVSWEAKRVSIAPGDGNAARVAGASTDSASDQGKL